MEIKANNIQVGNKIIGEQYKAKGNKFSWETYATELEVLKIKILKSNHIKFTLVNDSDVITKTFKPSQLLKIKEN